LGTDPVGGGFYADFLREFSEEGLFEGFPLVHAALRELPGILLAEAFTDQHATIGAVEDSCHVEPVMEFGGHVAMGR
jgi:hypothetical protein